MNTITTNNVTQISMSNTTVSPKVRKLQASYTVEMVYDLAAMHSCAADQELIDLMNEQMGIPVHLSKLKRKLSKIKNELKKQKDLEAIRTRRQISLLEHQVRNHKRIFPHEYI